MARRRWTFVLALVTVACSSTSTARADEKDACLDAHFTAQALRKRGAFREARQRLGTCVRPKCPKPIVQDCVPWLDELDREQPSIVLSVRDATGKALTAVRVFVDGQLASTQLDGKPADVDPGEHMIRVEAEGAKSATVRVLVHAGEKGRLVTVDLEADRAVVPMGAGSEPPEAPRAPPRSVSAPPERRSPVAAWAFGGLGVAALGAFAYFGISGVAKSSDLRSTCAPNCDLDDIDAVRRDYLVADVALGASVLSLGVAAWLFFSSSKR